MTESSMATTETTEDAAKAIREAKELISAMRAACDRVIRFPPSEKTATITAGLRELIAEMDADLGADQNPWFYFDPRTTKFGNRVGGDPLRDFHPMIPPIEFTVNGAEGSGTVRVGPAFTGPPGRVHGGVVSTILDHVMGTLVASNVQPSVTARLEVDFLAAAPIGEEMVVTARITKTEGRKVWVEGEFLYDGKPCVRASALFISPRAT